jgi:hypothetical protein
MHLNRHHDMGGNEAGKVTDGVEEAEHVYDPWEKRTDAILRLLSDKKRKLMTVDELRRGIEDLGPGAYDELSYYERWIASITNILIEKGVIGIDELGRKMAEAEIHLKTNAETPVQPKDLEPHENPDDEAHDHNHGENH